MAYQSIIRLLEYCNIDGFDYTKNDAFINIDSLKENNGNTIKLDFYNYLLADTNKYVTMRISNANYATY